MEQDKAILCKTCAELKLRRSEFERPPFEPDGKYYSVVLTDTLGNLRSKETHCSLCRLILHAIQKNEQENPDLLDQADSKTKWELLWKQSCQEYEPFGEASEDMYGSALFTRLDITGSHDNYCIQLVDEHDTSGFLRGRMLPDTASPRMVQAWLDRCYQEHGLDCRPVALEMSPHPRTVQDPFIVVDVDQECLVELPARGKYIALSYVWGPSNWPRTLNSNFEAFKQPGASLRHNLPRTISDAVGFVKALNQRYLWVDSICIIQDHDMKKRLIDNMDSVYRHAHLCIIAASGHEADSGLSGWSDKAERSKVVVTELIAPDLRLGVLPFFDGELMSSAHAQRAWTFQEGLLSTRCVVFLNSLVYFCCRATVWREDLHAELGDLVKPFEGANILGRTMSPWPLRRFQQHITAYTYRVLSFPSDILNAFAGVQKTLAQSMDNTRFWYGMPASVFDWALIWSGPRSSRLRRRWGFPSWSWAGWEGYITMALDQYGEFDHEWLLYRTWIDWYIIDEKHSCVLVWEPERDGTRRSELLIRRIDDGRTVLAPPEISYTDAGTGGGQTSEKDQSVEENDGDFDEEDGFQELQPCPQYGWPVEGNPYGRRANPHYSPPFPVKPPSTMFPTPGSLKCGTLCFQTISIKYNISRSSTRPNLDAMNEDHIQETEHFTLTDAENRICGIIWDLGILAIEQPNSSGPAEAEILLLSYAAPGTKDPFDALELSLAPPYQGSSDNSQESDKQKILNQWHTWDMFNVMLITPTTTIEIPQKQAASATIYESRGVGLLHKKALGYALTPGPCWKEVYLS